MESREQLEKRVSELEREVSALKAGRALPMRGIRKRSAPSQLVPVSRRPGGDTPQGDGTTGPDR